MLLSQGFLDCELLDLEVSDSPAGLLGISHEKLERCLRHRISVSSSPTCAKQALSKRGPVPNTHLKTYSRDSHFNEVT